MGTRADFYVGRGVNAEWLGSVAYDGCPGGLGVSAEKSAGERKATNDILLESATESEWRGRVADILAKRDDATLPKDGWPWPWEDSRTTDYAYALDGGKVWASCFGGEWFDPLIEPSEEECDGPTRKVAVFPDMTSRQKVTLGARSGVIVFGVK